jgi:hypothetical protein
MSEFAKRPSRKTKPSPEMAEFMSGGRIEGPETASPEERLKNVTVRLTDLQLDALRSWAKEEDRSIQKILQRLVVPALEARQANLRQVKAI